MATLCLNPLVRARYSKAYSRSKSSACPSRSILTQWFRYCRRLGLLAGNDGARYPLVLGKDFAGVVAIGSIDAINPQPGETILIVGATGGVGAIATQYAGSTGVNVIATAKPGAEADFVRSQGAQIVVDPTGDLAAQVRMK